MCSFFHFMAAFPLKCRTLGLFKALFVLQRALEIKQGFPWWNVLCAYMPFGTSCKMMVYLDNSAKLLASQVLLAAVCFYSVWLGIRCGDSGIQGWRMESKHSWLAWCVICVRVSARAGRATVKQDIFTVLRCLGPCPLLIDLHFLKDKFIAFYSKGSLVE